MLQSCCPLWQIHLRRRLGLLATQASKQQYLQYCRQCRSACFPDFFLPLLAPVQSCDQASASTQYPVQSLQAGLVESLYCLGLLFCQVQMYENFWVASTSQLTQGLVSEPHTQPGTVWGPCTMSVLLS